MSADINGYCLTNGLTTENAGMCQWGFAKKDERDYFIKEFLSPKYPVDDSRLGPELTEKMRNSADDWFGRKSDFYAKLSKCRTGNIVIALDFFRHGTKYYAVTDKIEGDMLAIPDIVRLTEDRKYTFIRSLLYSMSKLHGMRIVHSDLRPENILVKQTKSGYCTAKIIDFDAGFLEDAIPDRIEGSQNYFSPEAVQHTNGQNIPVTTKADVWALGLLIHQYWSGNLPGFSEEYHYASEAVLDGSPLFIADTIPSELKLLISKMLARFPDDRPTAEEAWKYVCETTQPKTEPYAKPVEKSAAVRCGWYIPDDLD